MEVVINKTNMQHLNLFEDFANEATKQKVPSGKLEEIFSVTNKELGVMVFSKKNSKHVESAIAEAVFSFNKDAFKYDAPKSTEYGNCYDHLERCNTLIKTREPSAFEKILEGLVFLRKNRPNEQYTKLLVDNLINYEELLENIKSIIDYSSIIDNAFRTLVHYENVVTIPNSAYSDENIKLTKESLKNLGIDMSIRIKNLIEDNASAEQIEFLRKWWPEYTEHARGKLDAKKFGFDK